MKKLYIFLVFIFIVFVSSCSAMKNEAMDEATDGVSFKPYTSYIINDIEYSIYLPLEFSDAIYYEHELGDVTSMSTDWSINFIYDVNYHVDHEKEDRSVWVSLYENLLTSKSVIEEWCWFVVVLFDPYSDVELEYILHNETNKEASYVVFYTFLPVRLVNNYTKNRYTIGIPINVDVLLKIDDKIENPFDKNEMILWEDFLAI